MKKTIMTIILILFLSFTVIGCGSSDSLTSNSSVNELVQAKQSQEASTAVTKEQTDNFSNLMQKLLDGFSVVVELIKKLIGTENEPLPDKTLTTAVNELDLASAEYSCYGISGETKSSNGKCKVVLKKLSSTDTCSALASKYEIVLDETDTSKKNKLICLAIKQDGVIGDCHAMTRALNKTVYGEEEPNKTANANTKGATVYYYKNNKFAHAAIYLGNEQYMDGNTGIKENLHIAKIRKRSQDNEKAWFGPEKTWLKF